MTASGVSIGNSSRLTLSRRRSPLARDGLERYSSCPIPAVRTSQPACASVCFPPGPARMWRESRCSSRANVKRPRVCRTADPSKHDHILRTHAPSVEGRCDLRHRAVAWPGDAVISSLTAHAPPQIVQGGKRPVLPSQPRVDNLRLCGAHTSRRRPQTVALWSGSSSASVRRRSSNSASPVVASLVRCEAAEGGSSGLGRRPRVVGIGQIGRRVAEEGVPIERDDDSCQRV
jgi:hypothetical protein